MVTTFPDDFLFGCATSAYQVEGGITNDWSRWEAGGGLKDPDVRCGPATDHWNRYEDDFGLLAGLGANAYRFSIEWARVEPEPGQFDRSVLERYRQMVDVLRGHGVEPFVTLLHFTHPPWFHDQCPWHSVGPEPIARFARFVAEVADVMGDSVRFWTVLNEPMVWLAAAYLEGVIPPGSKGVRRLGAAFFNLVRAHAAAHRVLKDRGDHQVGVANNMLRFAPASARNPLQRVAANYIGRLYNHGFLNALHTGHARLGMTPGIRLAEHIPEAAGTLDFVGVNYYSRVFVDVHPFGDPRLSLFYEDRSANGVSDLGWEFYPEGLTEALVEAGRYGVPIYVTENGLDDRDDSRRAGFLFDHLQAVGAARARGADVRGYMFWSLLDNFEWLEGFGPRFGLFRVDYETFERSPTQAAAVYQRIIRDRRLPESRPADTRKPGTGRVPVG